MRKYEPAWQQLKTKRNLRLAVPSPLHKRVIKAIIKEKYQDDAYKFERSEQGYWDEIQYHSSGNIITFSLVTRYYQSVSVESI